MISKSFISKQSDENQILDNSQLDGNQNKNNCLVRNFYNKLKFPALFSVQNGWQKSARNFNLL